MPTRNNPSAWFASTRVVLTNPSLWTTQRLADYMAEQIGIRVDQDTIRLHLKAAAIVFSRPQHKITSPDPEHETKEDD